MMRATPVGRCQHSGEGGFEEQSTSERISWEDLERDAATNVGGSSERLSAMTLLHQHGSAKRGEELSGELYDMRRQEQNSIAARLDKELQSRWDLDELIEEQLSRYHSHYNLTVPTSLKDVANLLTPTWLPQHERAAMAWLGDWRPSSILDLVRVLATHHPSFSLSETSKRMLSQLLREIRVEEAVIDEEYAEIQATCVLHLPFSPLCNVRSNGDALRSVQELFRNIQRVISKAQQLRYKVLEQVMKKLLKQTDAAEFLVAFASIQDAIHQFGEHQKLRKLFPNVPLKGARGSISI
ncbi:PREDICTED: uncharacterized protein LOC104812514 isoform X2 [Tarenaya hassleriana]|uniref:uncharacterized protein LOC104812514 isoform X2 n=1 Tax=Tarenaya hassleriana TaxID=28532 RepID=UPI0008FD7872|nr:PREDICTED: uncharacterized protein LOC104812514 isoform X2 [Tarenaya hassleriana]